LSGFWAWRFRSYVVISFDYAASMVIKTQQIAASLEDDVLLELETDSEMTGDAQRTWYDAMLKNLFWSRFCKEIAPLRLRLAEAGENERSDEKPLKLRSRAELTALSQMLLDDDELRWQWTNAGYTLPYRVSSAN
jgi:hypothetical protein